MMKKNNSNTGYQTSTEKDLSRLSLSHSISYIWFGILLLIYIVASVFVIRTSHSEDAVLLFGQPFPLRSLTGALSSIANLCLVFLVVFYRKPGFYVSLFILICQIPALMNSLFILHSYTGIAGFFSNLLVILAICLLYANNNRLEKYQTRLRRQAITDRTTGLPNRYACSEMMDDLITHHTRFCVAVINLSNFKKINNMMGQHVGNEVLSEIAGRLRRAADDGVTGTLDFFTCQGGDEFCLIIRGYQSLEDVYRTLEYYQNQISKKLTIENCDYYLVSYMGVAEYPADTDNSEALLACASTALFNAKRINASKRICRFTQDLKDYEHDIEVEQKLRSALEDGRLFFCMQPQFDIDHKLRGFEVLCRMRDTDGSIISPATFIPVAENVGLIDQVDHVIFRDSTKFFGELIKKTKSKLTISVNISVRHLMKNDFLDEVREILNTCEIPPDQLELEITESIMIDSMEKALHCIQEIKKMGVKIAIDDFGTGYSSLSYLNNFPADLLKVDKSFIDNMNSSDSSQKYVAAIISIGHIMNFDVIAEGVEKLDQLDTLRAIGCDYIQGFYWGVPLLPSEAEKLVLERAQ